MVPSTSTASSTSEVNLIVGAGFRAAVMSISGMEVVLNVAGVGVCVGGSAIAGLDFDVEALGQSAGFGFGTPVG